MSKTTKAISSVTILLIISRLFGFIREMTIAAHYGATYQTDAYNMALNIISLAGVLISATVSTVIIPMYNRKRIQQSKNEADLFMNNLLWITSLFYVILSIPGIIFAPTLVKIFAPKFDADTVAITIKIVRIMFIFTVAINITNFMTSIAQINNKFAVTVIAGLPFSILTIIFVVFFAGKIGIYALITSYMLFLIIQALICALSVRKVFNFKAVLNFTDRKLKSVVKLSLPIYASVAVWEISMMIDKILASGLPEGSISAMGYASKLRALPDGIITAAVITVIFPILSKYAANKQFDKLKKITGKAISLLFMVLLPVILISVYYAGDITKLVYERGDFTAEQTALTANIFIFSVISLIFSGCASLLNNLFYSMQNTKSPQISAVIMLIINIALNLILVRYMQAAGLALATSIASLVYFIILFIQCRLKYGTLGELTLLKNVFKYIISASGMIPVFFLCEITRERLPLLVFFSVAAIISLFIYALMLFLLKAELFIETCMQTKNFLRRRLRKADVLS